MKVKVYLKGASIYCNGDDFDGYDDGGYVVLDLPFDVLKPFIREYFDLDDCESVNFALSQMEDFYIDNLEEDEKFQDFMSEVLWEKYNKKPSYWDEYVVEYEKY